MSVDLSGDIQSRVLAFPKKQIAILIRKANGWEVQQSGWGKKFSKGWKNTWNKTCDIASDAWKSTCEVAQKTCESVQEFWEDHKYRELKQSSLEFRDLVRDALNEFDEAKCMASLRTIEARYPQLEVDSSVLRDNYASSLSSQKPEAPFREVPLIGYLNQSTIHFHCGINIARDNSKLKQVHVTFSNGGHVFKEALKQLPSEYRETIIVITTGTTAIIEDHLARKVYNIIGDKDWPSRVCNGGQSGIEKAEDRGSTVFAIIQGETETGVSGHYFTQPNYQEEIRRIIDEEISIKYEVY